MEFNIAKPDANIIWDKIIVKNLIVFGIFHKKNVRSVTIKHVN